MNWPSLRRTFLGHVSSTPSHINCNLNCYAHFNVKFSTTFVPKRMRPDTLFLVLETKINFTGYRIHTDLIKI